MILRGNKGGGSTSGPSRKPDDLRSEDTLEVILGLGEGEWKGLVNGGKSFYLGDTPLVSPSGQLNFGDFELLFYPGSGVNEKIVSALGGFGNSTNVSVNLLNETPVTRTTQTPNITYLELRLVVQSLYKQTEAGDLLENTLELEIEYKPTNSTIWLPAYVETGTTTSLPAVGNSGSLFERYSGQDSEPFDIPVFTNDVERLIKGAFYSETAPPNPVDGDLWFLTAPTNFQRWELRRYIGTNWVEISSRPKVTTTPWLVTYGTDNIQILMNNAGLDTPGDYPTPTSSGYTSTYWFDTTRGKVFRWGGGAWVDISNARAAANANKKLTLTGKTTSSYVKELRWPVASIADTFDIRVKKLSIDPGQNGNTEDVISVSWESFQEIIGQEFEFDNTACAQLVGTASGQFSGIPEFWGVYEGRLINVPTNYDPDTRLYSGVWDGTFKRAYTNNPAWIWYDLQVNDRFGRSAYYPVVPNKWDVYEAGVYCDELVPDGEGGTQPRWTFNQWVTDAQGVKEMSRFLAGTFTGVYTDDTQGGVTLRVDKDSNAVAIFTQENVLEGNFDYSFTDIGSRANDITVSWINPDLLYNEDRVRVKDDAHIAKFGRIPLDITAFGCRSRGEAVRRGRARLISTTTEIMTASFRTNRLAQQLDLYDIILIADETIGFSISGRVKSFLNGSKTIWELHEPIYLETGVTYTVNVQVPNPSYPSSQSNAYMIVERALSITQPRGLVSVLNLDGAALDVADEVTFALSAPGELGLPKPFRVVGMNESKGEADDVEILAVDLNRNKWAFIDDGELLDPPTYSSFLTNQVSAPTNLRVVKYERKIDGEPRTILELAWDRAENKAVRQYRVQIRQNNGPVEDVVLTPYTSYEFLDLTPGEYVFYVSGRTITGVDSQPASFPYSFFGDQATFKNVLNLRVEDSPDGLLYDTKSPVLVWD